MGVPNALFWDLTRPEVLAVLKRRADVQHVANLRAGLVAAAVINSNRPRGRKPVMPGDFFRDREREYMDPKRARAFLLGWASDRNKVAARTVEKQLKTLSPVKPKRKVDK